MDRWITNVTVKQLTQSDCFIATLLQAERPSAAFEQACQIMQSYFMAVSARLPVRLIAL